MYECVCEVVCSVPSVCVCCVPEADDDGGYWAIARSTLLSDPKEFLRKLLEYDKDGIDSRTIAAIQVCVCVCIRVCVSVCVCGYAYVCTHWCRGV